MTEIARLDTFFGELPPDVSEDAAYNALLQIIVASGTAAIESQDPVAHTIVTKHFGGQTLISTCPINHYFVYALRIVVVGGRAIVSLECQMSLGWEGGLEGDVVMPRNRGELKTCDVPGFVSKADARIPSMIFGGAMDMLNLHRMTRPDPTPQPSAAEIRNARWWCSAAGVGDMGSCDRSREGCEKYRSRMRDDGVSLTECRPRERAVCFDMRLPKLDNSLMQSCHPTVGSCADQFKYVREKRADEAVPSSECHAVE